MPGQPIISELPIGVSPKGPVTHELSKQQQRRTWALEIPSSQGAEPLGPVPLAADFPARPQNRDRRRPAAREQ